MYPQISLQPGQTGQAVKQLQDYLVSQGFMTQAQVNTGYGTYGPQTTRAVKEFQESLGVDNSTGPGYWGPRTIAAVAQKTQQPPSQPSQTPQPNTRLQDVSRAIYAGQITDQASLDAFVNNTTTSTPTTPTTKSLEDVVSTVPELKQILDVLSLQIDSKIQQGEKVNPDLTITPEVAQKFLDQATSELEPYYQELIRQHKQDLSISFQQLQEDYTKQIERVQPEFQKTLEAQDSAEAESGTAFSSGRVSREKDIITKQQQQLDDFLTVNQRDVQSKALTSERAIGSRNFADLGIPSLQTYAAGRGIIAPKGEIKPTGSRSLYTPQTGLYGTLPAEQKTATSKRQSELTQNEINKRILDASVL